ncbi:DUF2817 domain-containing protein [Planctomicrobium sp.]|jgi:hypothetical protein|nr:DUF2817 domain-containing protein [Planctomicrobium sp.]MBT5019231.1 DUF2817 domain-containing protein [Planctomicrobium sp.]MDB4733020.1 DUF2817 domain-containing protein [Planctomicrobium sp.]
MSRNPFGLCFCVPVLMISCASLMAPTIQAQNQAQQQPSNNSRPQAQSIYIQLGDPAPFEKPVENQDQGEVLPERIGPVMVQVLPQHQTVAQTSTSEVWKVPFHSSAQRPVELSQSGLGSYRILIMGSMYGNEPESIELLEAVIQEAISYGQSPSYSFLMIRTPNPDGLAEHIRTNHNGVDLNRNFPSTWFTASPNRLTGPFPASEVETKNLMRILKEFQPHRVLHLRSSIGQRPLLLLNEQLAHATEKVQLQPNVDVGTFSGQYKAGSLEEFVTLRIDAELMTVLLPPKGFQQLSTKDVFQLATTNFGSSDQIKKEEPVAKINSTPPSTIPAQPIRNILEPDGEKGYVEMLPPPPTGEPFNRASKTTIPNKPEFYELPPPPK